MDKFVKTGGDNGCTTLWMCLISLNCLLKNDLDDKFYIICLLLQYRKGFQCSHYALQFIKYFSKDKLKLFFTTIFGTLIQLIICLLTLGLLECVIFGQLESFEQEEVCAL